MPELNPTGAAESWLAAAAEAAAAAAAATTAQEAALQDAEEECQRAAESIRHNKSFYYPNRINDARHRQGVGKEAVNPIRIQGRLFKLRYVEASGCKPIFQLAQLPFTQPRQLCRRRRRHVNVCRQRAHAPDTRARERIVCMVKEPHACERGGTGNAR